MSTNTVRKYVSELEDKHLLCTESTTITRDGRRCNGTLRYYIQPIQEAIDHYHEQQLDQLDTDAEQQRVRDHLSQQCAAQEQSFTTEQATIPPAM